MDLRSRDAFIDEMEKIARHGKSKRDDEPNMNFFERHPKKILGGVAAGILGGVLLNKKLQKIHGPGVIEGADFLRNVGYKGPKGVGAAVRSARKAARPSETKLLGEAKNPQILPYPPNNKDKGFTIKPRWVAPDKTDYRRTGLKAIRASNHRGQKLLETSGIVESGDPSIDLLLGGVDDAMLNRPWPATPFKKVSSADEAARQAGKSLARGGK